LLTNIREAVVKHFYVYEECDIGFHDILQTHAVPCLEFAIVAADEALTNIKVSL